MQRQKVLLICAALLLVLLQTMCKAAPCRPRLSARALVRRRYSPWSRMYRCGDHRDWLHVMGLDRTAFNRLMPKFSELYKKYTLGGQKMTSKHANIAGRVLAPHDVLGLVLHWLCSSAQEKYLCLVFGVTEAVFNRYKHFGCMLLLAVLRKRSDAAVKFPSKDSQRKLAALTKEREPLIDGCWGFVDGLNLKIENPGDVDVQNAYYNGWVSVAVCSAVIVWRADGLIAHFTGNYPGSWHDAAIANRGLFRQLAARCDAGSCVAADSAFPKLSTCPHMLRVDKESEKMAECNQMSNKDVAMYVAMQNAIISVRQAAEWGMGLFQASFKRLKLPLYYGPFRRKQLLQLCIHMQQYKTVNIGLNQIQTVFGNLGALEELQEAALENYYGTSPAPGFVEEESDNDGDGDDDDDENDAAG